MSYFNQKKFISNSDLGELKKALNNEAEFKGLDKIYDFGSRFDAVVTEPEKINDYGQLLDESDLQKIELMAEAGRADKVLSTFIAGCKKQHEVYRNRFEINWQGNLIEVPVRCKFDLFQKSVIGADLKSTAATTQKAFEEAIIHFNYDRQSAWYMDIGNLDRFMFIGVCKKADKRGVHKVFKYAINKGDEVYEQGKRKYSKLAFLYYYLIYNLNLESYYVPDNQGFQI